MQQPPLTPGEFELMEILWDLGEASVKQVWKRVAPDRALAYTTVMTVLDKMRRKGLLSHRKQGKAYLYSPALEREQALEVVLEQLVSTYFSGSRRALEQFVHRRTQLAAAPEPALSPRRSDAATQPLERGRAQLADIDEFLL